MTEYSTKNDGLLVDLTLLGNEKAFSELVTRYERAVKGTAFKVTHNSFLAEDASQDAFVSAWINLSKLRDGERFGPWVCAIAKNHAIKLITHYKNTVPDISLDPSVFSETDDSIEDFAENEVLYDAVEALSEKIREAVKLHYFEDMQVKDIAKKCGISEGTVKWRLSEGRKQLRKGYGIMEKTYNDNEKLLQRVMRQVEQLKLWRIKNNKEGFEEAFKAVIDMANDLDETEQKYYAISSAYQLLYWWQNENKEEIFTRLKESALKGHNDEVMQTIALREYEDYDGKERIDFIKSVQIPFYTRENYPKTTAYLWFWLGYEYHDGNEYDNAIDAYKRVLEILSPTDVYYATALAALRLEEYLKSSGSSDCEYTVMGESYKKIGNKLYFWEQPGFSHHASAFSPISRIAGADNLVLDFDMQVGECYSSSDGVSSLTFESDRENVKTPAGSFDNCRKYVFRGSHWGNSEVEVYLKENVGVVRQVSLYHSERKEIVLISFNVKGEGLLPLEAGNTWHYAKESDQNPIVKKTDDHFITVTGAQNDSFVIQSFDYTQFGGYENSCEGKLLEARRTYFDENDNVVDVMPLLSEAKQMAVTKRQKNHANMAYDVMERILCGEESFNPESTVKGRWNFFQYRGCTRADGKILIHDDRLYSFEGKDLSGCHGLDNARLCYSFFDDIICEYLGCIWDESWQDGYKIKKLETHYCSMTDFVVTAGEAVTTPAGIFQNCRHISFTAQKPSFRGLGYFAGKCDYWYAEGIGIVKVTHKLDESYYATWNLTEYRGVGVGYFPTNDGIYRRYEPEGLENGYHAHVEYLFDENERNTVLLRNTLGWQERGKE